MPVILVIDDQPYTRLNVVNAVKDLGYETRSVTDAKLVERRIRSVNPDLILINKQPGRFESIPLFMELKEKFPEMPVLLYALQSETAVKSLKQAVVMALKEIRSAAGSRIKPVVPARSRELRLFNPL